MHRITDWNTDEVTHRIDGVALSMKIAVDEMTENHDIYLSMK